MKKLILTFSILVATLSLTSCGSQEECITRGMANHDNINQSTPANVVSATETIAIK